VVLPNLYGDVLSDVAAQIAGSVGLAGSANIGESIAMFEAIHGSAPRRAGQNLANPSGLFLGAVMMLVHTGQTDIAERAHNAWIKTMEDGVHTYDIYKEGVSREKVGTREFAEAVVARLGQKPSQLKAVSYKAGGAGAASSGHKAREAAASSKQTVGVDVYLDWTGGSADELGAQVSKLSGDGLKFSSIANRGVKVYPDGNAETFCSDHWRCRFNADGGAAVTHAQVASLLSRFADAGLDFIKTENLCNFDGKPGYSHAQE
ncbi:MAG: NADP-dependent isocitrate dehydrogenase, partial [Rubrivivax sp.]|nr:NADP-dependent isocitrate dehydrogenase [Pyrinomonadaceae bacterium]